jgi:hypothetical protein
MILDLLELSTFLTADPALLLRPSTEYLETLLSSCLIDSIYTY